MSEGNNRTLQSYEAHVQEYIDGSPQQVTGHVKAWLDRSLTLIPDRGEILELGSAHGKDAAYVESIGYHVHRTDATRAFVERLLSQGHTAEELNAITDEFGGPYDMILADAVLLHFSPDEFRQVLRKSLQALKPGGILAFSVKAGDGSEWSDAKLGAPRFFQYWREAALRRELSDFEIRDISLVENGKWLMAITQKPR